MEPTKVTVDPTPLENKLGLPSIVVERFMALIDRSNPDGCWIWKGSVTTTGYGAYRFGPQGSSPWKAHRLSYSLAVEIVPKGSHLHHKCNTPLCVRPAHLQVVSPREHVHLTPTSISYKAAHATHCAKGHPFDEANTGYRSNGKRWCKACNSAICKKRHAAFRKKHPVEKKTHCKSGHPLSGRNLIWVKAASGNMTRRCRECSMKTVREYQAKNRDEYLAYQRENQRRKRNEKNQSPSTP